MSIKSAIHRKAVDLGKLSVEMTSAAGSGHPSTALSLAHLVATLLYHQMRWDPKDPWNPRSDRLVLSEGHAVPILYAALSDLGAMITPIGKAHDRGAGRPMTRDDVMRLREIDSPIDGHPNPQAGVPFFDAATGSLGQGLSVAAGLAAVARMDKVDRNIYCLIGDGESREGQIWEAMDFIADHALTNCVPIFNCNELAQSDWVSPQQSAETLAKKAEAFGFIARIVDGHDPEKLLRTFSELHVIQNGYRPFAVIARTIKGWGAAAEQGMGKHGTPVKKDKLGAVLAELDQIAKDLGVENYKLDGELKVTAPAAGGDSNPQPHKPIRVAPFREGLAMVGLDKDLDAGKAIAPRKAYGAALVALGAADERVVALDADVKNSTHAEWFYKKYPQRFLEAKIAEQNMISVAAGASAGGKIPFVSTFAKFFERAYDQIEMAIISGANLKLTGSHAGVTLAADGPSQMSLPDVAFFRSFAHANDYAGRRAVHYFFPADAVSCYRITELMANIDGTCYQRTLRAETKLLYKPDDTDFTVGGFKVLREGKDLCFVSAGYMVHECLRAADEMAKIGRSATVIDAYSLPLNTAGVLEVAARSGGTIVTVEDNYTGGLDAELAIAIANSGDEIALRNLFVGKFPKSGKEPEDVLNFVGLGHRAILEAVDAR
ncbi:MAG TPA: transketolase [Tepidisphaeraceae bacterium]|nr:transketolase [Tepidisphaeraceae bacterium]